MTANSNVIIRWNTSGDSWYIRGIGCDGTFYGEIRRKNLNSSELANVDGCLSADDNDLLRKLVSEINEYEQGIRLACDEYEGLIAVGSISTPVVLLRYTEAQFKGSEISAKFKQIIELIRPYMEQV
ncbi:MAG: hypothetical protein GY854_12385 [Deltaproteobacteria bacterium]|nr:hypothetical protein [Deltaproteobacteria bacterium]